MKIVYSMSIFFGVFSGLYGQNSSANVLQKIFVHITGHKEQTVEVGNIIFNFANEQHVDLLKSTIDGDFETRTYFFPMAKIASDVKLKEALDDFKGIPPSVCSMALAEDTKPILGVKLIFRYNSKLVDITYNSFNEINMKKGVIFRIYNKVTLNQLQHVHDDQSLLTVAMNTGAKTVVIDCGHGGDDDGAIGFGNIKEKNINLAVGLLVAQQLKKKGVNALLTRSSDITLSLKDRIVFANKVKADLFVSIHSNAASNQAASGVETFGVVPLKVMYDNAQQQRLHAPVQRIIQNRIAESMDCATAIQTALVASIKKIHNEVKDRFVKRAPLLVLLGTTMPAALVEVGFVSNLEESQRLDDRRYQKYLAHGITDGISNYLQLI